MKCLRAEVFWASDCFRFSFVDFTVGHLKSEMLQNYKLFECHVNAQKSVD